MDNKILSKIQKLLALAADNPDKPESKLAAERAGDMMAKYNIGLEDIKSDGTMANGGIIEENVSANSKHHQIWEAELAGVLCACFDCKRIIANLDRRRSVRTFIGAKADVALLIWFYKYLRLRIAKSAESEFNLQKDQKVFGIAAVRALRPRLEEMYKKKEEVTLSDCRSLVLNKQLAVTKHFDRNYGNLGKKTYSRPQLNQAAWSAGTTAGQTMGINQQVRG